MHIIGTERRAQYRPHAQFNIWTISNEQNLSSTSGEPEFFAQYFFEILASAEQACNSQIHCPWMADIVDSAKGLLYRGLRSQPGGPVRQPYAAVNFIPPFKDYEFGYRRTSFSWQNSVHSYKRSSPIHNTEAILILYMLIQLMHKNSINIIYR